MKVLFLTTQLPFPPHSGGTIKSFRLAEYLARHLDLTVLCIRKAGDEQHLETFRNTLKTAHVFGVALEKKRSFKELVRSYLFRKTINEWRSYSRHMQTLVDTHITGCSLVIIDHYEMFQYLPADYRGKTVLHTHNAEHRLWERFAALHKNPFTKLAVKTEAWRIRQVEHKACERADLVFAAPDDIRALLAVSGNLDRKKFTTTYHLGNDSLLLLPDLDFGRTKKAILFFGTLGWEANLDGLMWFIKNVWPLLLQQEPGITFYIIGNDPPKTLRKLARSYERIVFTGFVEDLDTYFSTCRVFVNPVRFGSGIKVKMLDAMYRGIPTVSSETGIESLDLQHRREVLVARSPEEWCSAIRELLGNKPLWDQLRMASRAKAARKYRWKDLLEDHLSRILALVEIPS